MRELDDEEDWRVNKYINNQVEGALDKSFDETIFLFLNDSSNWNF